MEEESLEELEQTIKEVEIRWAKLLEESKDRELAKENRQEKWNKLITTINQVEKCYNKDNNGKEKPEVLQIGPRPKTIKNTKREEDIKFEIFPLPKPKKNRGDFVNRSKLQLTILNLNLKSETDSSRIESIKAQLVQIKKEIKSFRRQAKKMRKIKQQGITK